MQRDPALTDQQMVLIEVFHVAQRVVATTRVRLLFLNRGLLDDADSPYLGAGGRSGGTVGPYRNLIWTGNLFTGETKEKKI